MLLLRALAILGGLMLVTATLAAAVKTFVLPRGVNAVLTRIVFVTMDFIFRWRAGRVDTYERRDQIMAMYAPISLMALTVFWVLLVVLGYTLIYLGLGVGDVGAAFTLSGSSLLTLGFANAPSLLVKALIFSEATIGLGIVALLVAYLPTMYAAFARRETAVTLLDVRAGSPPAAAEWLKRAHRIGWLEEMGDVFQEWERWFADIEESHTSLASLVFFRSPQPEYHWVTAAGAVLDTAALYAAALDVPRDARSNLCIRAGYLALRRIAAYFDIPFDDNPHADDPITISREEFDDVLDDLERAGVPLRPDRERAWRDFAGWRVNYDAPLVRLAGLTMAPYAPWSSDRSLWQRRPFTRRRFRRRA